MRIVEPSTPEQLEAFRGLLREWFDRLVHDHGIDMGYQSIEAEMAGLPGYYGPPTGGSGWPTTTPARPSAASPCAPCQMRVSAR